MRMKKPAGRSGQELWVGRKKDIDSGEKAQESERKRGPLCSTTSMHCLEHTARRASWHHFIHCSLTKEWMERTDEIGK